MIAVLGQSQEMTFTFYYGSERQYAPPFPAKVAKKTSEAGQDRGILIELGSPHLFCLSLPYQFPRNPVNRGSVPREELHPFGLAVNDP